MKTRYVAKELKPGLWLLDVVADAVVMGGRTPYNSSEDAVAAAKLRDAHAEVEIVPLAPIR